MNSGNRRKNIAILTAVNLAVFLFFVMIRRSGYEGNDDELLNLIAAGAFGTMENHLIYMGILAEAILKAMYSLPFEMNWYLLFLQITSFLSLTVLSIVFFSEQQPWKAAVSALLLNVLFAGDFYLVLQYTKSAALAAAAGLFAMLDSSRDHSLKRCLCGIVLFVLGLSIRFQSAVFITPFFLLFVLEQLIPLIQNKTLFNLRDARFFKLSLLSAASVTVLVYLGGRIPYLSQPWQEYQSFNEVRTDLLDYGFASYDPYAEQYVELGISYTEYQLLSRWVYADTEAFSTMNLRKIRSIPVKDRRWTGLRRAMENFCSALIHGRFAHLLIVLLGFAILSKTKRNVLTALFTAGILLAEYVFLGLIGRINVRVELCIWAAAVLVMIYTLTRTFEQRHRTRSLVLNVLVAALSLEAALACGTQIQAGGERSGGIDGFLARVENEPENTYLMDEETLYRGGTIFSNPYDIDQRCRNLFTRIFVLGGWEYPAPFLTAGFSEKGIVNPMRDLLEKDNVFLASTDHQGIVNLILQFLQENYAEDASVSKRSEYDGIGIYEFERAVIQ